MRASIRRQVALSTLVSTVGLLLAMGVIVVLGLRLVLVRQLDRALREEGRLVQAMVEVDEEGIQLDFEGLESGASAGSSLFLEVWDADGTVLHRSASLAGRDLPEVPAGEDEPRFTWVELEPPGRVRCISLSFSPRVDSGAEEQAEGEPEDDEGEEAGGGRMPAAEAGGTPTPSAEDAAASIGIALARSDEAVAEVLSGVSMLLAATGLVLGAGAVALSLGVARRGLRPLREFAARIAQLDDRSLSSRLDVGEAPEEVAPVGERLNELLDRVEQALERERAFSADVAHELRTPLAGLRATIDVALRGTEGAGDQREALVDMLEATQRLQALVDRLLWLVRLDAGTVAIEARPTDLAALLRETWNPLRGEADARRLRVQWNVPEELWVVTDPMLAGIAMRNVLENAVAYADECGRVEVRIARNGGHATVQVENSGSLVRQEDVPGLLRRFARGDQARTPVGSRCGLGLALVDRIAGVLGHGVEIRSHPGGSFEVTISMAGAG
ncbi:MAG: sensor histidine kinase [Candidatus Eiseniibacteriota bacterium]